MSHHISHVELNSVAKVLLEARLDSEELFVFNWELESDILGAYVHGVRDRTRNQASLEEAGLGVRVLMCGPLTIAVRGESSGFAAV